MSRRELPIIGLTLREAVEIIEDAGYAFRVTSRDGKAAVCTADYRNDRLNLKLVEGKITSYDIG